MSGITTHVLDTSRGRPASGVPVELQQAYGSGEWRTIGHGATDPDGRLRTLMTVTPAPGLYRLRFQTSQYFAAQGIHGFYPEVLVTFEVADGEPHYHVPLLLSPFGYSTYRGS